MPVIPATQDAEIRRIAGWSQSWANGLWDPISKKGITKKKGLAEWLKWYNSRLASSGPWVQTSMPCPPPQNSKKWRAWGKGQVSVVALDQHAQALGLSPSSAKRNWKEGRVPRNTYFPTIPCSLGDQENDLIFRLANWEQHFWSWSIYLGKLLELSCLFF
jgi:hypothetical protein